MFYRKAAEEIVAAQKADPTLGYRQIGERIGKSKDWCRDLVIAYTTGEDLANPWAGDSPRRTRDAARKHFRDSTPEEIAETYLADPEGRPEKVSPVARLTRDVPR